MPKKFKKIPDSLIVKVQNEVYSLLHASRDGMRNIGKHDTKKVSYSMTNDGGYGAEAFGVMRGLVLLGYGYFGSVNIDGSKEHNGGTQPEHNFKWWFAEMEHTVLEQEGFFNGTHRCEWCIQKYRKDDTRVRNLNGEIFNKTAKPIDEQIMYTKA